MSVAELAVILLNAESLLKELLCTQVALVRITEDCLVFVFASA